jgi:hypothetical protein
MLLRFLRGVFAGRIDDVSQHDAAGDVSTEKSYEDIDRLYQRARMSHDAGRVDEAEESYRHVLTLDPSHTEASVNLALVLRDAGRLREAIPYLFRAVRSLPDHADIRRLLADSLLGVEITNANDADRNTLASLCKDERISNLALVCAVSGLTKAHPAFTAVAERSADDVWHPSSAPLALLFHDVVLLAALPRMIMADPTVEAGLSAIRRSILLHTDVTAGSLDVVAIPLEFVCALARNCFLSAYAFFAEDDEAAKVQILRAHVETSLSDAPESWLAVLAMYMPLHQLSGSETLRDREWSDEFQCVVQEQITDRLRERALVLRHPPITAIDDEVSLAVNAQYEDNPYPRWISVADPGATTFGRMYEDLHGHAPARPRTSALRILIAGCGSGRHPIQVARQFPQSEILAVDLSLASLGYAARMTENLGIQNITYRQGDLLNLAAPCKEISTSSSRAVCCTTLVIR